MVWWVINVAKNRHTAERCGLESQYTLILLILCVLICFVQKLPHPVLFHEDLELGSQPEL